MKRHFQSLKQLISLSATVPFAVALLLLPVTSQARGGGGGGGSGHEDSHMVSNGQGVSSPSFWDGLSGENPAGLAYNQSLKLQAGGATFDNSLNNAKGSGAVLIGNGLLGAGLEYSMYNASAYPAGSAQINWGIAGYLTSLSTSIGVSGHHVSGNNGGIYDVGALIQLGHALKLGVLIPDFTNGLHVLAGGLNFSADAMVDFVIDGAFDLQDKLATLKPGINLHTDLLEATFAYGVHVTGASDVLLYKDVTAGLGIKLSRAVLLEYEYRGMPQHRVGLTLKLD